MEQESPPIVTRRLASAMEGKQMLPSAPQLVHEAADPDALCFLGFVYSRRNATISSCFTG